MALLDAITNAAGSPLRLVLMLACVALATVAQTLTGFAFGLIFLSLVTSLDLVSVQDAANVATMLTLVNAVSYYRSHREAPPWRMMKPALLSSCLFVIAGLLLLHWLSEGAAKGLKLLLGTVIVACAIALVARSRMRSTLSSPWQFAVAGALSGVMGGLFGTSGPPIVYHLYRQPLPLDVVRRSLLLIFALNSLMRLGLVTASGGLSLHALLLAALAVPVVHVLTRLTLRVQSRVPAPALRWGVAGLLVGTGGSLVATAMRG